MNQISLDLGNSTARSCKRKHEFLARMEQVVPWRAPVDLVESRPAVFTGVSTLYTGLTKFPGLKEEVCSRLRLSGGGAAAIVKVVSNCWKAITGSFIRQGHFRTGEAVKLFVVKMPGAQLLEADVIAHCRTGMTGYKLPKAVLFTNRLPRSAVGKILSRELRGHSQ